MDIDFHYISLAAVFPLVALVSLLCIEESPDHLERRRRLREQAGPEASLVKLTGDRLKFPANSPAVYVPFALISSLICLQHFSGFTYSKRFLVQVINSASNTTNQESSTNNSNTTMNTDAYYWAILICCIYLISSLVVAKLLQSIRRRFMFFLSLLFTSLCLIAIGMLMEGDILSMVLSQKATLHLQVFFLCFHVFVVQCGLQGLPSQLMDILFPSSCKSIMKGICRAVTSLSLVIFISIINLFPDHTRFWIMAGVLIFASPILFIFVPEIRNVGRSTAGNFILPFQTVFYTNIRTETQTRQKWKNMVRKISMMNDFIGMLDNQMDQEALTQEEALTTSNRTFTFEDLSDLEDLKTDDKLRTTNHDLVNYISNILPQSGFLHQNQRDDRILVARGPTQFPNDIKKSGGIFLFDDVLILAKTLLSNWRYVNEISFDLRELEVTREDNCLSFTGPQQSVRVAFDCETDARTWGSYIEFCQRSMEMSGTVRTELAIINTDSIALIM